MNTGMEKNVFVVLMFLLICDCFSLNLIYIVQNDNMYHCNFNFYRKGISILYFYRLNKCFIWLGNFLIYLIL